MIRSQVPCFRAAIPLVFVAARALSTPWIPYGPAPEADGYNVAPSYAPEAVSGHVRALAYSPDIDGHGTPAIFLGAATGGVWRSTDFASASPTWAPLANDIGLSPEASAGSEEIGCLTVDPNHPRTIYAGTGWPVYGYGNGVLKSTDGGNTWSLLGTSQLAHQSVAALVVDPTDQSGSTVYCATQFGWGYADWGIYRSSDGAATWTRVSAAIGTPALVRDLTYTVSSTNVLTLYAGVVAAYPGDAFIGVWKSTDGGSHWTRFGNLPTDASVTNITFAADHIPGPHPAVFAAFAASSGNLMNLYKTTDGGVNWAPLNPPDFEGGVGGRGNWGMPIGLAPNGSVYLGGLTAPFNTMDSPLNDGGVQQSVDGGATWTAVDIGTNGIVPHTDFHAWTFAGSLVFAGNDGGVWRFHPRADGSAGRGVWDDLNTPGLQTIQCIGASLHPTDPAIALEGSQDNGAALRGSVRSNTWEYVFGGDNGLTRFDPADGNTAYVVAPQLAGFEADMFRRSSDGGKTWDPKVTGLSGDSTFPFFPTFAIDPSNTSRLVIGSATVYETQDRGDHWAPISPALGGTTGASALCYAPSDGQTIYAAFSTGYSNASLFRTSDDGATWADLTSSIAWNPTWLINSITVDPIDPLAAYVTVYGFGAGKIWHTDDGGTSWVDVSGDLPDVPVNCLAVDSRTAIPTLYAGTDVGVWSSADMGAHWTRFGAGLPVAKVKDIQLNPTTNLVGIGTYGRGVWVLSLTAGAGTGDVNGDGQVNLVDAALALRSAAGLRTASWDETIRGDVVPDLRLSLADAVWIARHASGL